MPHLTCELNKKHLKWDIPTFALGTAAALIGQLGLNSVLGTSAWAKVTLPAMVATIWFTKGIIEGYAKAAEAKPNKYQRVPQTDRTDEEAVQPLNPQNGQRNFTIDDEGDASLVGPLNMLGTDDESNTEGQLDNTGISSMPAEEWTSSNVSINKPSSSCLKKTGYMIGLGITAGLGFLALETITGLPESTSYETKAVALAAAAKLLAPTITANLGAGMFDRYTTSVREQMGSLVQGLWDCMPCTTPSLSN